MKKSPIYLVILLLFTSCSTDQETDIESETDDTTEVEETDDTPEVEEPASRPNIVLVIADDMGLDASPGYDIGSIKPNMPHLQDMIDNGIIFNNVWANPTCTPTRGTILTGKYGFRTDVIEVDNPMSTAETSVQRYLDENTGSTYSHAVIGKWHLSNSPTHPNDMGVGYYAGFRSGTLDSYFDWDLIVNGVTEPSTEYATTKFTDLAIDWVADQSDPWFLWLSYNAPHTPFHLPPEDLHSQGALAEDQASIDADPLPYYMAMLEAMDTEFGRFLDSLDDETRENTIFIFLGDNGSPPRVAQEYERSRTKETVYQGGINVPMVVSGKDVTRANAVENALINTTDLFATVADIAGTGTVEINDSKSFRGLLTDGNNVTREFIYAEIGTGTGGSDYTIGNATHKYLVFDDGTEELYNLVDDPLEDVNLLDGEGLPIDDSNTAIKGELEAELAAIRQ